MGNTFNIGETAITYGSVVMLLIYLVFWFILRETAWGRHVYAVGDNPEATRLAGISTKRLLISVYAIAGFIYGIAGLLLGRPHPGGRSHMLGRQRTWTASRPWCWVAPASLAVAALSWER